eukprot:617078-Pleurochrysis_carterae.AAC.1
MPAPAHPCVCLCVFEDVAVDISAGMPSRNRLRERRSGVCTLRRVPKTYCPSLRRSTLTRRRSASRWSAPAPHECSFAAAPRRARTHTRTNASILYCKRGSRCS